MAEERFDLWLRHLSWVTHAMEEYVPLHPKAIALFSATTVVSGTQGLSELVKKLGFALQLLWSASFLVQLPSPHIPWIRRSQQHHPCSNPHGMVLESCAQLYTIDEGRSTLLQHISRIPQAGSGEVGRGALRRVNPRVNLTEDRMAHSPRI
jgi:hypothetical protein